MKIEKKYLILFLKSLKETNLNLTDSRMRDEFYKDLFEATKSFEEAQQAIYKSLCKKDKDENPEMTELGQYQFEGENAKKVVEELEILNNEEVEFTIKNPAKIKEFLNLTEYKPKVNESEMIDFISNKL